MKIYVVCRENCPIDSNYVEKTFDNLYEDIPPVAGRFLGPIDDLEKAEKLRKELEDDFVDTAVYIHLASMSEDEIRVEAKKLGVEDTEHMGKGKLIDEIFGETCEGTFIQPTFITDYPVEMSPACCGASSSADSSLRGSP